MEKYRVGVVDPALGVSGGHHVGFAMMLGEMLCSDESVDYFVNEKLDNEFNHWMTSNGMVVQPCFSSNFYSNYSDSSANSSSVVVGIIALAKEYIAVIEQVMARGVRYKLLYHTLNWDHANALSLAIQYISHLDVVSDRVEHCVLLMFNPGLTHNGVFFDKKNSLNFRVGLRKLEKMSNVSLCTSCSEYSSSYSQLLGLKRELVTHPFIFCQKPSTPHPDSLVINGLHNAKILVFVGDAKRDKGFHRVPDTLRWLQENCDDDARLVIQYSRTPSWETSNLIATEHEIQVIAASDSRIEVCNQFWTQIEFEKQMGEADFLILDYEQDTYAEKTSGYLWHAFVFGLAVLAKKSSWMWREGRRFGLPVATWSDADTLHDIESRLLCGSSISIDTEYVGKIFQPFWAWFTENPLRAVVDSKV